MSTRYRVRGFTLVELLVVIAIIAILILLLLPAINAAREAARRNGCINKIRQVAMAVSNFESAVQRYPLAVDAPGSDNRSGLLLNKPGGTSAGYSWLVQALPYMEESILYGELKTESQQFTLSPFDQALSVPSQADPNVNEHLSERPISALTCPSYAGSTESKVGDYQNSVPAVTNYVCMPATHKDLIDTVDENGLIVSGAANNGRGYRIRDLVDGVSKTIILCESREENYAAWIDGQATWVLCVPPSMNVTSAVGSSKLTAGQHSMQWGPEGDDSTPIYFQKQQDGWPGDEDREWGPSSFHAGSVVVHAYADVHVQTLTPEIDPSVYMWLITRSGGENVDTDNL